MGQLGVTSCLLAALGPVIEGGIESRYVCGTLDGQTVPQTARRRRPNIAHPLRVPRRQPRTMCQ